MFLLKLIRKFVAILQSASSPAQIARGFAVGALWGLSPGLSLQVVAIVIILFIFNINIASAIIGLLLFRSIAWLLDPVFHALGFGLLVQMEWLRPFWTVVYNASVAPLSRFNNTVVLGGFLCGLILLPVNYYLMIEFVKRYRTHWQHIIDKWKIVRIVKGSKIVGLFMKVKKVGR